MSWSTGLPGVLKWCTNLARTRVRGVGRRARGFTLLEIIVAFTILAVALVSLLQAFGTGLRGLSAAQASAGAVMIARSKLEEVGLTIPLRDGESSGETDQGYEWRVSISRIEDPDLAEVFTSFVVPYRVEVSVKGANGGAEKLVTMRLGEPE
jgi:general secretion pathway protein I